MVGPRKDFDDLGPRQKRRRLAMLEEEEEEQTVEDSNSTEGGLVRDEFVGEGSPLLDFQQMPNERDEILAVPLDPPLGELPRVSNEEGAEPSDFDYDNLSENSGSLSDSAGSTVGDLQDIEGDDFDWGSDEDSLGEVPEQAELKRDLCNWVVECGIPRTYVTKLLKILRKNEALSFLPSDYRALLRTMRHVTAREMGSGSYYHFGMRSGLVRSLMKSLGFDSQLPGSVDLLINIDGVPLSKSSGAQFWPILAVIMGEKDPFVIGIYEGKKKPDDINSFLEFLLKDIEELEQDPICIRDQTVQIRSFVFSCDFPARSFLLCIKGHTGYFSCSKCETKGEGFKAHKVKKSRPVFPETDAILRTDQSFRDRDQPEHHAGTSPLEQLTNFDMVTSVPLDPMHLLDLGVTKKLLELWKEGKQPGVRLSHTMLARLSERLISCKDYVPSPGDFARGPRDDGLKDLARFKATEFRLFRMHLGPIVLKDVLPDLLYKHFLTFHVATRLLSIESKCQDVEITDFCEGLLKNFVKDSISLYGKQFCVPNVHGLIHLPRDVLHLGPIETFAAYPFENYNQKIKNLVKKGSRHIQQVVKRLAELEMHQITQAKQQSILMSVSDVHFNGPLPNGNAIGRQFLKATYRQWTLTCDSPNNCVVLIDGLVVVIENFLQARCGEIRIVGRQFAKSDDFFSFPIQSRQIGTFRVSGLSSQPIQSWPLTQVKAKALKFHLIGEEFVISSLNEHKTF